MTVSRRQVLKVGTLGLAGSQLPLGCTSEAASSESSGVFLHGVASGDPLPDSVILWTRLSGLAATNPDPVEGSWEVAESLDDEEPMLTGRFETGARRDYTVKVEAQGLRAGTTYYYRFRFRGAVSPWGRTRTAPHGATPRLRFAVVSCASYAAGYFHAYRAIAERADIDAVIHLGDYIYEHASGEYGSLRDYDPPHELLTLDDYRRRYAQYRSDPDLMAVHQQIPFLAVWDDHEVANNAWRGGAENHQVDEGDYQTRKRAAQEAYFEWLPVRESEPGRVHRSFRYGDLVQLILADTRHWGRDEVLSDVTAPEFQDPDRSILGADQESWLERELSEASTVWRVLAQQVVFSNVALGVDITDSWDGYPANRERVLGWFGEHQLDNVAILSGDIHMSWAFDVVPAAAAASYDPETGEGALAVELVAPSVTSPSLEREVAERLAQVALELPHVRMAELTRRGFLLLDVDEQRLQGEWYLFDRVDRPSDEQFFKALALRTGECHLREVAAPALPREDSAPLAPPGQSEGAWQGAAGARGI